MDFLAELNQRLLQQPQPKSLLAPYFEAVRLFQSTYHTPSATPSPLRSPEPDEATTTSSKPTQPSPPPPTTTKRKLEAQYDNCNIGASRKRQRRMRTTTATAALSPTVTGDSLPSSQQSQRTSSKSTSAIQPLHESYIQSKRTPLSANAALSPPTSPETQLTQQVAASTKRRRFASASREIRPCTTRTPSQQETSTVVGKYTLRWTATRARQRAGTDKTLPA